MTQRRRVRALHLASCCTLHTYSIGCTASQRNNIVTIHHTSAVNKTSGSFCHPRSSSLAALTLSPSSSSPSPFPFLFTIYSLSLLYSRSPLRVSRLSPRSFSLPDSHSNHVFATSAYLFDFFFPPVLPAVLSPSRRPFLRVSFSLLLPNQPPTHPYIFSISLSAPVPRPSVFPSVLSIVPSLSLSFSFALVSRVYAGIGKKHPRHESRRLTFCSFVGHRRY